MSDDPQANENEAATPEPASAYSRDSSVPQGGFPWGILVGPVAILVMGLFDRQSGPLFTFGALLLLGVECVVLAVLERDREDTSGRRIVRLYLAASLSLGLAAGAGLFILVLA